MWDLRFIPCVGIWTVPGVGITSAGKFRCGIFPSVFQTKRTVHARTRRIDRAAAPWYRCWNPRSSMGGSDTPPRSGVGHGAPLRVRRWWQDGEMRGGEVCARRVRARVCACVCGRMAKWIAAAVPHCCCCCARGHRAPTRARGRDRRS
jgi:hypothetical protein